MLELCITKTDHSTIRFLAEDMSEFQKFIKWFDSGSGEQFTQTGSFGAFGVVRCTITDFTIRPYNETDRAGAVIGKNVNQKTA